MAYQTRLTVDGMRHSLAEITRAGGFYATQQRHLPPGEVFYVNETRRSYRWTGTDWLDLTPARYGPARETTRLPLAADPALDK